MKSATEQWYDLVEANKAKGMSNDRAVRQAALANPGIHKAYLAEYNAETQDRRARAAADEARKQAARFR